jgi:hypothetical protein
MARMEIITGPERRRSWSEEQKRAIVVMLALRHAIEDSVGGMPQAHDLLYRQTYYQRKPPGKAAWRRLTC